ncbi:MAG TPA: VCBS repeat-containing protein [Pyrinomonadaceae bacterium]|nr:hypothetical protein [Chloracidobacterium sp.]HRK50463.1 VCBS repeat-containing protein [Pyrinomonadaceae bacterium]
MSWMKGRKSSRTIFMAAAAISCVVGAIILNTRDQAVEASKAVAKPVAASPAAVFPANAGTLGPIPDNTCTGPGRSVTFTVSGLTGAPSNIVVNFTSGSPAHSWVGDVDTVLLAPGGAPTHEIFTFTNPAGSGFGDDSNLAGPYNFFDAAAGNWWAAATAATSVQPVAAGDYRTASPTGTNTSMNPVFAGVANPNGTWTLRFNDCAQGDTGGITAANLTIETASAPEPAEFDFNGDGRTDYTVARDVGPGASGATNQIRWFTRENGSGTVTSYDWGSATTDFITPSDFDGDDKTDYAVWREAAAGVAGFYILQSQTNTFVFQNFGQTGDDPAIIGDYDGDGKSDPAVYRCPPFSDPDGQCFFYYRGSNANPGGNITFVPWGFGVQGDFFPNPGDFDGDGRYDFCIQRSNPAAPAQGQFVLLRSSDNGIEYINWGTSSDFIIPGDYDGDGKHDFCVRRTVSGARQHWVLTRTGATSFVQWGSTGDVSAPGDYDGDGSTDFAIWRGSATPGQSGFWVRNSSNAAVSFVPWGQCPNVSTCDFAVASSWVH